MAQHTLEIKGGRGIHVSAKVDLKRGVHALVGIINSNGEMYAQGVLSFEDKNMPRISCTLSMGGEFMGEFSVKKNLQMAM